MWPIESAAWRGGRGITLPSFSSTYVQTPSQRSRKNTADARKNVVKSFLHSSAFTSYRYALPCSVRPGRDFARLATLLNIFSSAALRLSVCLFVLPTVCCSVARDSVGAVQRAGTHSEQLRAQLSRRGRRRRRQEKGDFFFPPLDEVMDDGFSQSLWQTRPCQFTRTHTRAYTRTDAHMEVLRWWWHPLFQANLPNEIIIIIIIAPAVKPGPTGATLTGSAT